MRTTGDSTTSCAECDRPVYSRGLCSRHYQHARYHGELPDHPDRPCEHCGKLFGGERKWGARYCSAACKDAALAQRHRAAALAAAGDRRCLNCGTPIPADVTLKAKCCSRACRVVYQNAKRAEANRAQLLATRQPCALCGGEIPEKRRGGSIYCSAACKKKVNDAAWRKRSPHYNRQYLYGLTQERYEAMLAAQGGRCAICGSDEWPATKDSGSPRVDHRHDETRRVRGLLCDFCNRGLGMFREDPARLRAAADYLEAV